MIDLNQLKNTEVSSPSDGEVLRYRGGKLRNEELCELWEDTEVTDRLSDTYPIRQDYVNNNGTWSSSTSYKHWVVPVDKIRKVMITANEHGAYFSFFKSYEAGNTPVTEYASGYSNRVNIPSDGTLSIVVPADAKWLYIYSGISDYYKPISVLFTGTGITEHRGTSSQFVKGDGTLDNNTYLTQETNPDWNATSGAAKILNKPKNVSDFTNDVGYLTQHQTVRMVNGETLTGDGGDINLYDGFYFPNAVQDVCGNWYDAVVVGDQVWMTENLRTTKYPDGTDIPYGNDFTTEAGKYYYYSSPASYRTKYGLLYNWTALMNGSPESDSNPSGVQSIAPSGWHVPSLAEWQQLDDYVKRQKRHNLGTDSAPMIKKALASRQYWYAVAETGNYIGTDTNKNNSTGLNLKAGGAFYEGSGAAQRPSFCAHYWSSTQSDEDKAYFFAMSYTGASYNPVVNSVGSKTRYLAVRCVSNLNPVQFRAWYVDEYGSMQNHRPDEHPLSADLVTDGSQNKVFTLALKDKLDSIEEGAQKNVQADWNQDDPDADDFIKGKPQPAVPSGTCDSTSTSTAYVANNVQGITALKDGVAVYLYNGVVTSAGASDDVAYGESVPSGKGFTLNINGLGPKPVTISRYASTIATSEWTKGYRYLFIYNSGRVSGGAWEMYGVDKDTDTLPIVYCTTAGGTRGKVGKCTNGLLRTNSYYYVFMTSSNTYSSNYITLNVNNKGAKRIYINGETSGVSNYDLPSGMYFVWYDGINFHFRTDGKLPLKGGAFGGSFNDLTEKPTIPADKVFRCQFLYVSGEGLMLDNVTPNDILNAHIAGKIVICEMVTDLYSTSTINVVMMLSDTENGPAFTGVRDCNGQTICFKMRYDTDEREWVVSTVNIGQSPVQADWNATSGLSQILNKPTIGKVVRVCHLQQNGRLVEDKINPVRTDEELYLVTFDSNTIPSHWIVCDGDAVVDFTMPDVPISTFQQGDVCLFLGKYEIVTNPFTNNTNTSLGLKLLFHSRWGQMLSALQSAAVTIHSGSGIPDDDLGSDGDIYIMTTT